MLRIAVQKASRNLIHPTDRRRLISFSSMFAGENIFIDGYDNLSEINYEFYDIIVVSHFADIPFAKKILKSKTKILIDYCDFIHVVSPMVFYIKSIFSYMRGNYSSLLSKKQFLNFLKNCDGIIVGSDFQKLSLKNINKIHVIPDDLSEIRLQEPSKSRGILWEGFSHGNYKIFNKLFELCKSGNLQNLQIVTDSKYALISNFLFKISTKRILKFLSKKHKFFNYSFSKWDLTNLIKASIKSNIALIPIASKLIDKFKPENKIILHIRLGLFPIVSAIPSYVDFEKKYGIKITFEDKNNFKELIGNFEYHYNDFISKRNKIIDDYSKKNIYKKWKKIIINE